jgi:hypothetical protein
LRTADFEYIHNGTDELELYDMNKDPWQIDSQHRKVDPSVLAAFEQRIQTLVACHGASCRGN